MNREKMRERERGGPHRLRRGEDVVKIQEKRIQEKRKEKRINRWNERGKGVREEEDRQEKRKRKRREAEMA